MFRKYALALATGIALSTSAKAGDNPDRSERSDQPTPSRASSKADGNMVETQGTIKYTPVNELLSGEGHLTLDDFFRASARVYGFRSHGDIAGVGRLYMVASFLNKRLNVGAGVRDGMSIEWERTSLGAGLLSDPAVVLNPHNPTSYSSLLTYRAQAVAGGVRFAHPELGGNISTIMGPFSLGAQVGTPITPHFEFFKEEGQSLPVNATVQTGLIFRNIFGKLFDPNSIGFTLTGAHLSPDADIDISRRLAAGDVSAAINLPLKIRAFGSFGGQYVRYDGGDQSTLITAVAGVTKAGLPLGLELGGQVYVTLVTQDPRETFPDLNVYGHTTTTTLHLSRELWNFIFSGAVSYTESGEGPPHLSIPHGWRAMIQMGWNFPRLSN